MALKSKSIQLPGEVWDCLEHNAKKQELPSISSMARTAITEYLRKEVLLNSLSVFRTLLHQKPHAVNGVRGNMFNEILLFMDVKGLPLVGTEKEMLKQLTELFTKDRKIIDETLNYLEKRALHLDDETIVEWWKWIPLDEAKTISAGWSEHSDE